MPALAPSRVFWTEFPSPPRTRWRRPWLTARLSVSRSWTFLTQLAVGLPEPLRSELLDAVAGFESDGDIQALLDALASGDLTGSVQELVTQQLDDLSTELNDLLDQFQTFAGQLPPDEAAQLEQAIALLRAELASAGSSLEDLIVAILAGLPEGDLGSLCELLGQLPVQLPIDFCPAS